MTAAADTIIARLDLRPHPEGGHYRETFRDMALAGKRAASTAILFLLKAGERSHWHRIDAAEIWHFHAGAPLRLDIDDGRRRTLIFGPDVLGGETPQGIVAKGAWQSAQSLGDWTLVGCTVAPGFDFKGFDLAPPDFEPSRSG